VQARSSDACNTLADTVSKCDDTTATATTGTITIADATALACSDDAKTLENSYKTSSECSWWLQSVTAQKRFQRLLAAVCNAQVCNGSFDTLFYSSLTFHILLALDTCEE
jgi:hypothetical protein